MEIEQRKVGFGLVLGVILLPIVFSWATLRDGYSTALRVIAVGWMVLFSMFIVATPPEDNSAVAQTKDAPQEPEPVQQKVATVDIGPEDAVKTDELKVAEATTAADDEVKACETLECLAEQSYAPAKRLCTKEVERQAEYDVEWTDSFTEARFVPHKLSDESPTAIMYFGDSVKFQNGFGAWQNMTYICKFETATGSVDEVAVSPGRL